MVNTDGGEGEIASQVKAKAARSVAQSIVAAQELLRWERSGVIEWGINYKKSKQAFLWL